MKAIVHLHDRDVELEGYSFDTDRNSDGETTLYVLGEEGDQVAMFEDYLGVQIVPEEQEQ